MFDDIYYEYENTIINHIKNNGFSNLIENNFDEWYVDYSELDLPIFDKIYDVSISKIQKNCKIHIQFEECDVENVKLTVGKNGDEYDLSDCEFTMLIFNNIFDSLLKQVIDTNKNLMITNLEKSFKELKRIFKSQVTELFFADFEYYDSIDEIPPLDEYDIIDAFEEFGDYMRNVYYIKSIDNMKVLVEVPYDYDNNDHTDITTTPIGKKILKITEDAYNAAIEEYKKEYNE